MIEVYLKTNTNYEMNGDITLTPISCTYKDSEKIVKLEHPIDELGRYKYLNYENVIKAEGKLYRIYNVIKSLYSVTAYARPIFFDLIDNVLLDVRPTQKNGQEALNILLEGTQFKGHSNISNISTSYYVRKNIVEAILGNDENSFLNRWGGEVLLDNFDIYINDKIGSDNGVRVEFGYNLNEIEQDINIDEVATRIIPTGYNGIMIEGSTPWVDSPLIKKYTKPKQRVINFDDVKVKENAEDEEGFNTIEEARQELIKRCNKLYEEGIDKPKVNYKIDMVNLANTTAYKGYMDLVKVNDGDTVTCYIPDLDINVQARVVDYEKDLITGEYISLELGNAQDNFFNNQADLQSRVDSILNGNGTVKADMLNGAINALDTKFKALRDVAQPQTVRAMLFEDRVQDSPTFGCMCIGTMGFEIADSFKPGTTDWNFRTFGTGKGFIADCIVAGTLRAIVLESLDGSCKIDLRDGIINISKGIIKGLNSSWDLTSGVIKFTKGLIEGANSNWNLDTGIFTTSSGDRELKISNGGLKSTKVLWLESLDEIIAQISDGTGLTKGVIITPNDTSLFGDKIILSSRGGVDIKGDVNIAGSLTLNGEIVYPGTGGGGATGGNDKQKAVVNSARKLIGVPYVYGGNYPPLGSSSGTDCSGLCQWAYNDNGISISRTTYTQISDGTEVEGPDSLQPGDLVFPRAKTDNGHVFMFSGRDSSGNLMCVEAYDTGYNISEHTFTWGSNYRARRIIN